MNLLILALGLVLLVAGAELLVRGASRLATRLGLPSLVIGLTGVAYGTSAPELAVSLQAALAGSPELAVGNVVGSNIFNTLFILGASAALVPLAVSLQVVRFDVWVVLVVSGVALALALDGRIGRLEGLALVAGAVLYTVWTVMAARREATEPEAQDAAGGGPVWLQLVWIGVGLALLVGGSRALVVGATEIARAWGVSELVIGLTVVAAGTSLPEVAASLVAALRGERDIAVGNVLGSNLFNLLAVLGGAAALSPVGIEVSSAARAFDLPVMLGCAAICVPIFFTDRQVNRWEGILLLAYYAAYVAALWLAAQPGDGGETFRRAMLGLVIPLTALALLAHSWRQWRREATP